MIAGNLPVDPVRVSHVPGFDVPGTHPALRPALLLDRDGVINANLGHVHRIESTEWIPGIFDLCRGAHAAGRLIVVVTNQAGIARGLYDEQTFHGYTRWMHDQFKARGILVAATYFCPHHPQFSPTAAERACSCRKPLPGMFYAAAAEFGIDLPSSVMVGDAESDWQAARAAGVGNCLLHGKPLQGSQAPVSSWHPSMDSIAQTLGWTSGDDAEGARRAR